MSHVLMSHSSLNHHYHCVVLPHSFISNMIVFTIALALIGFNANIASCSTPQVPSYNLNEYIHDGRGNEFMYPQMTAITSNQSIIVYHYAVDGIVGQAGLSIISPTGNFIRSITSITTSVYGEAPPGNFLNSSSFEWSPYACDYMYVVQMFNQITNQSMEMIEMILPSGRYYPDFQWIPIIIDLEGRFVDTFNPEELANRRLVIPYQYNDQLTNLTLTVNYTWSDTPIFLISNYDQSFQLQIDLMDH